MSVRIQDLASNLTTIDSSRLHEDDSEQRKLPKMVILKSALESEKKRKQILPLLKLKCLSIKSQIPKK